VKHLRAPRARIPLLARSQLARGIVEISERHPRGWTSSAADI